MKTAKLLVLTAILLATTHLTAPPKARAVEFTIRIATQSPLTGPQAAQGIAIRNGVDLATRQFQETLNRLGRKLEFVPFDDQNSVAIGIKNAQEILADDSIVVVIGHIDPEVAVRCAEIYNHDSLAFISPAVSDMKFNQRGFLNVNRTIGSNDVEGIVGANYAVQTLKAQQVYILYDQTNAGQDSAIAFRDTILKQGVKILAFGSPPSNFEHTIAAVKAAKPDLVYFSGAYSNTAAFFSQAHAAGVTAQFMTSHDFDTADALKVGGDALNGVIYTTLLAPASTYPDTQQFIDDYKKAFGIDPEPLAAESYAAAYLAIAKIQKSLTDEDSSAVPTRERVATNIRKALNVKTIIGGVAFDANGDRKLANYYIYQVTTTSADKWKENKLLPTIQAASPLTQTK
jgi:branched-chain amino acid transport system substrate-binding protein